MPRANIMLSEKTYARLQEIPKGERSKLVDVAIVEALRRRAAERMDARRKAAPPVSGTSAGWVRRNREEH